MNKINAEVIANVGHNSQLDYSGYASLDDTRKALAEFKAVFAFNSMSEFPIPGKDCSVYIDLSSYTLYYYDSAQSMYVPLAGTDSGLKIGYAHNEAFRGSEGKAHVDNKTVHISDEDRSLWNNKQDKLTDSQMSVLNSGITSESVAQIAANKDAIAQEITDREEAIYSVELNVDTEKYRAQREEQDIRSNLDEEIARAKAEESSISASVSAETTRATAKEAELETAISQAGKIDDVQVNGESVVTDKVASIDLSSYARAADLNAYVNKSGDTMTGALNVPVINDQNANTAITIATGTNSNSYFQARKFRGQGDANTYNHSIDFGYSGHDRMDFYEYGGVFNFWANRGSSKLEGDNNRVASLQIGKLLERRYTLTYPGKSGIFALTDDVTSGDAQTLTDAKAYVDSTKVTLDGSILVNDADGKATINELYRSGCLAVDTVTKRNDIDMSKLAIGTRCYVKNDEKFYRLTINSSGSRMWTDDNETETFDSYASSDKHGTVMIGDNLKKDSNGKLTVDVVDKEEKDSSKPISSGAVYNILGDIKTILDSI